jgi:tetratricopeptide (TPR) repeat protein
MKRFLILALASACACAFAPEMQAAPPSTPPGQTSAPGQTKQQAFISSAVLFQAKDYDHAEAVLEAGNKHAPGTPQWNMESGSGLLQMGFALRSNGNGVGAVVAAQRSAAQLVQAIGKFDPRSDPAALANAYELLGVLYLDLLGDAAEAERNLAMAVQLSPGTGQAPMLLARLRATKAEEQGRNHK